MIAGPGDRGFVVHSDRCRSPRRWLLLLPTLVLAQAHPEKRVALWCPGALQRRRVESGGGGRLRGCEWLLSGVGATSAATTLARGQLTTVVFDFQYLQLEESQGSDILCKFRKTKQKKPIVKKENWYFY